MKKKNDSKLFVIATKADVHELSATGEFITGHGQPRRVVGKTYNAETDEWDVNPKGVQVPYHPEYIKHLKEKALLPANLETAQAAGVIWQSPTPTKASSDKSSSDKG